MLGVHKRIQLTVKSVTFFAMQKNRLFLRQLMRALAVQDIFAFLFKFLEKQA